MKNIKEFKNEMYKNGYVDSANDILNLLRSRLDLMIDGNDKNDFELGKFIGFLGAIEEIIERA